jgi:hypothetical protein
MRYPIYRNLKNQNLYRVTQSIGINTASGGQETIEYYSVDVMSISTW